MDSGYDLSRNYFNWCFENPEIVKPIHTAIFFFAIEHCNRLGGKEKFGFPTQMTMEAIGVKKIQTYTSALKQLVEWGFITMIESSKNQYSANIISLCAVPKKGTARGKALDKAWTKHGSKQGKSTGQSKDTIDKPINQLTIEPNKPIEETKFDFKKNLIDFGFQKDLVDEWMKRRKELRKSNTERTFKDFIDEVKKTDKPPNEIMELILKKGWGSFEYEFYLNIQKNGTTATNNQTTFNRSSKDVSTDFSKPNGGF